VVVITMLLVDVTTLYDRVCFLHGMHTYHIKQMTCIAANKNAKPAKSHCDKKNNKYNHTEH